MILVAAGRFWIDWNGVVWYNESVVNRNLTEVIMKVNNSLLVALKKVLLIIFGLLQGTIGNYLGLLGLAFAFPQTDSYSKDYDEDMFLVPFGYVMMLTWLIVTIAAVILLRKNKANLLSYVIPWVIGFIGCLIVIKLW
ncbi:hypothetical protein [uncultured Ruminococcus sp.]|uniref:hypothetical protein n=1 Tax=uncultured Ruminococcus sp. TaxID=165186 RepID=UPI002672A5D2|nr:hypothetical protein [uncultured Ruminococcus sp.]